MAKSKESNKPIKHIIIPKDIWTDYHIDPKDWDTEKDFDYLLWDNNGAIFKYMTLKYGKFWDDWLYK